jgi:hypothetical protein
MHRVTIKQEPVLGNLKQYNSNGSSASAVQKLASSISLFINVCFGVPCVWWCVHIHVPGVGHGNHAKPNHLSYSHHSAYWTKYSGYGLVESHSTHILMNSLVTHVIFALAWADYFTVCYMAHFA